jgi:hypothetical protein
MKLQIVIFIVLLVGLSVPLKADNDFCGISNTAIRSGERLTYRVYYTVAGVYIGAGEAIFTNTLERFNGKDVYHSVGEGRTFSGYDKMYKVRDRYESYIDTATMQPYKFIRNVSEGDYKVYENISFIKSANTAITNQGVYKVPSCIQDVMSAVSYTRNLNFGRLNPGDSIPFDLFMDREVHHLYIRYLGKEVIRTKYAKFRAIKFRPLLIKSNMFEAGEKMTIWVSDDPNHVALRIESPIVVGKVKVDMIDYKNLRYPLSSLVSF